MRRQVRSQREGWEERNNREKAKAKKNLFPPFGLSYFSSQCVFLNIMTNFLTAPSIS